MDVLNAPLPLTLIVLALIDSLSAGTLLIPLFLLMAPGRVRIQRVLLYLATISIFYLLIGLLFLWGLVNLVQVAADFLTSPGGALVRFLVGAGMLIAALSIPTKSAHERKAEKANADASLQAAASAPSTNTPTPTLLHDAPAPGRLSRWRERLLDPATRPFAIMGVALAAGLVEVATMLPYIAAMTQLAQAEISTPVRVAVMVGYCVVMILPALVLLTLRVVAAPLVERALGRLAGFLQRTGAETTAWALGVVGFLIARPAALQLGVFEAIGRIFSP
ncbi:GAP family protein [Microbacterium keratanolyticum]